MRVYVSTQTRKTIFLEGLEKRAQVQQGSVVYND